MSAGSGAVCRHTDPPAPAEPSASAQREECPYRPAAHRPRPRVQRAAEGGDAFREADEAEAAARPVDAPPAEPLTGRELDVVRLVAVGRTNAEIAAELFVSLSTVKTHPSGVQLKLSARNRVEIAAWAWRDGHA